MLRRCYRSAVAPLSRVTAPVTRANGRSNSLAPRPPVRFSSFLEALGFGKSPDPPKAEELFKDVRSLYTQTLSPLNAKFFGPLEKASEDISPLPIVFVLGNHSSGKSSFINYVVGRKTQETGVAPTDDGFTCIVGGNRDLDQNGPAVVGDPTMGFGGLRQHGSNLINHLQLKVRENLKLSGVMIVDSPGMIDAPVTAASAAGSAASAQSAAAAADASRTRDRGYDFASVVKWFAERADVILLFQDPAKPGTTGETLNIMTTALSGMDYKLSIVLNKCDQFSTVHDFARAYGALCWNLSKVIQRKDLPRIYTMRVPVENPDREGNVAAGSASLRDAARDLDAALQDIVSEVHKAPLRRVDNLITRVYDSARLLRMHASVLAAVKKSFYGEVYRAFGAVAAAAGGLGAISGALLMSGAVEVGGPMAAATLLAAMGGSWAAQRHLGKRAEYYIEGPGLDEAFRRTHFLQLAERDEFVAQLWERTRGPLRTALRTVGIRSLPTPSRRELDSIDAILTERVPALRRAATKAGALYVPSVDALPAGSGAQAAVAATPAADAAAKGEASKA